MCFWARSEEETSHQPLTSPRQLVWANICVQTHRPRPGHSNISFHPPPPRRAKGGPGVRARAGSSQEWGEPASNPTQPGHRDPGAPTVASASHCVPPGQATSLFSSQTSWKPLSGQDLRRGPQLGSLLIGGLSFLFGPEARCQAPGECRGAPPELAAPSSLHRVRADRPGPQPRAARPAAF